MEPPNVAFVTKLDPTGSHLIYSTYLGGSLAGQTRAYAIAVDSAGSAYITGSTQQFDFPLPRAPIRPFVDTG